MSIETIDITLEVPVPEGLDAVRRERLAAALDRSFAPAAERLAPGDELAEALGLPAAVPTHVELRLVEAPRPADDVLLSSFPVKATIDGGPLLLQDRFEAVADVMGDLLYDSIQPLSVPAEALEAVGGDGEEELRFDLRFAPDDERATTGQRALTDQYCEAGYYSWSKGCSSWPW